MSCRDRVLSHPPRNMAKKAAIGQTDDLPMSDLTPAEVSWVVDNEARWRRAHEIAAANPHLDVGDIHHVLCTLHETPSQRVRRSLAHARLRPRTR